MRGVNFVITELLSLLKITVIIEFTIYMYINGFLGKNTYIIGFYFF